MTWHLPGRSLRMKKSPPTSSPALTSSTILWCRPSWLEQRQSPWVSCSHSFHHLSNAVGSSPVMAQDPLPIWRLVVVVAPATTTVAMAAVVAGAAATPVDVVHTHLNVLRANCVARRSTRSCAATSALMPRSRGHLMSSLHLWRQLLRTASTRTGTPIPVQLITSRATWRSCP